MKTSTSAVLAGLVAAATAAVQLEVRYSDRMVDVGTLDLMEVTRNAIYAEAGNERSILTDRTHQAYTQTCKSAVDNGADVSVQVKMTGAWGRTPGLKNNEMREGLVAGIFEALKQVSDDTGYEVYSECMGGTWQEGVKYVPEAACGPLTTSGQKCEEPCRSAVASPGTTQCMKHEWAHRVPSMMRVTAYIDDALQPDDLIFEFASTQNAQAGGCGIVGKIASKLASYTIPVAGGLFAEGITLLCAN
ncbi:hypothetical protein PpBr36_02624 [Pyricularia pennisetigena]|uniref:hypothetical protein n=1 Tax=Pyricularia pennisetigena TaxID=1578925 RepID=UPI00114FBE39|nr:hypothetical protein PpBr36_02624 [Pyricularia pennisetigena]TLS30998.1 hypothetical protein PpBr36_02624 [Pyricularia pennisetigena]